MSREYKETSAGRFLRRAVGEAWGIASGVAVLTLSGLLVTHLVRKIDKGLVHWPFHPERPIVLGGGAPTPFRRVG